MITACRSVGSSQGRGGQGPPGAKARGEWRNSHDFWSVLSPWQQRWPDYYKWSLNITYPLKLTPSDNSLATPLQGRSQTDLWLACQSPMRWLEAGARMCVGLGSSAWNQSRTTHTFCLTSSVYSDPVSNCSTVSPLCDYKYHLFTDFLIPTLVSYTEISNHIQLCSGASRRWRVHGSGPPPSQGHAHPKNWLKFRHNISYLKN